MTIGFDSIKRSYGRCVLTRAAKEKFFHQFYELFLNTHPDITALFEHTDSDKQIVMLKNAISMSILFAEKGDELAIDVLSKIRKSHSRERKDVKPEYYNYWLDSLIKTLWLCDPHFTPELEQDWRNLMQISIDYIVEGY
ncbi:MAG: globin [Gammaproteobacteria bacterium]|jgi:hemoglobin-like flavoprotein